MIFNQYIFCSFELPLFIDKMLITWKKFDEIDVKEIYNQDFTIIYLL